MSFVIVTSHSSTWSSTTSNIRNNRLYCSKCWKKLKDRRHQKALDRVPDSAKQAKKLHRDKLLPLSKQKEHTDNDWLFHRSLPNKVELLPYFPLFHMNGLNVRIILITWPTCCSIEGLPFEIEAKIFERPDTIHLFVVYRDTEFRRLASIPTSLFTIFEGISASIRPLTTNKWINTSTAT